MMTKLLHGIIFCNEIFKDRDSSIEKDDVHYVQSKDAKDFISTTRLLAEDVRGWREYKPNQNSTYYHNTDPKVIIEGKFQDYTILCSLKEFDNLMIEYRTQNLLTTKLN